MHPLFDMPSRGSIQGRSSSITAAFFQVLTPQIVPTDAEVDQALKILGMTRTNCACAYCGDAKTEWDHLRSIVDNKLPTGYITEIGNLVPACGKCNQSKGSKHWREWMLGPARRSPASRRIADLKKRVARLQRFEKWRVPTRMDYAAILGEKRWADYMKHRKGISDAMRAAQKEGEQLRAAIEAHLRVV